MIPVYHYSGVELGSVVGVGEESLCRVLDEYPGLGKIVDERVAISEVAWAEGGGLSCILGEEMKFCDLSIGAYHFPREGLEIAMCQMVFIC